MGFLFCFHRRQEMELHRQYSFKTVESEFIFEVNSRR